MNGEILPSFNEMMQDTLQSRDPFTGKKLKRQKTKEEQRIEELESQLEEKEREKRERWVEETGFGM